MRRRLARDDILDRLQDAVKVLERHEGELLLLAVGYEICVPVRLAFVCPNF